MTPTRKAKQSRAVAACRHVLRPKIQERCHGDAEARIALGEIARQSRMRQHEDGN